MTTEWHACSACCGWTPASAGGRLLPIASGWRPYETGHNIMPSEAVTVANQGPEVIGRRQRFTWSGDPWSQPVDVYSGGVTKTEYLVKPATTVNVKRSDGTRAMSAYETTWFRGANPGDVSSSKPIASFTDRWTGMPRLLMDDVSVSGFWPQLVNNWLSEISPLDRLAAEAEARTKTLNKLSQKKWDLGVTALEFKQTVGLVTDLAQGMVKTVDKIITAHKRSDKALHSFFHRVVRHGDFSKAAAEVGGMDINLLEDVRSMWMQYQFGIRPTVKDTQDAVEALVELFYARNLPLLVRAKAGATRRARITLEQRDIDDPVRRLLHGETTVSEHFSVVYEIPKGTVGPITTLGLDNPFSTLWESTRLSWMYDYALKTGEWLSSMTATNGMEFREGCRSTLRRLLIDTSEVLPQFSDVTISSAQTVPCFLEVGKFTRELLPPVGLVPAIMPSVRNELGLLQLGNSLFALSNVFSGKPGLR